MQTRSSSKFVSESSSNPNSTNSKHHNRRHSKPRVEAFSIPIVTMADNRTMEEMLQAPTEGYGDAIVVPDILAENFKIKTGLLSLIQPNQFHGFESNNPYDHVRSFNRITLTLKFRDVPNDAIKLMLFPYSFEGAAKIWYKKELPRSILIWGISNLHFELSFVDALLHMPKFALMFKCLLNNKDKLFDLAMAPVNENCSAVILKKLPRKLGVPDKFLIPCDYSELDECLALVDLVVDYVVDPCVPLILGRPFLRTGRALIDVYGEELTLRVNDEAITFKVGQTSKYFYNDAESINQIDVIDVACEEYVQDVLGFSDNSKSGSPTPTSDHIISSFSPSFTPFEGSDFILEEIETFLRTSDEPSNLDDDYYDTEEDILYLEKLLNEDPSLNLPSVKTGDLKQVDATMTKSSIEEPPKLELKELPSHLECVFLEGTDKLPRRRL
nr:reverse transcriptase domain-containing protein [Tanacetum cinerariifolium]